MSRLPLAAGICALALCTAAHAEEKKYTLADLEALAKSESWSELMHHLEDIPPAQRNQKWQAVVERCATGSIKSFKKDRDPLAALIYADGLTKRYKFLKKSKSFMANRAEAGLKGFSTCFEERYGRCDERLLPFVEEDETNFDLAVNAAQLMLRNANHYFALPYYKLGWDRGKAKVCAAKRLGDAVIAGLSLPDDDKKLPMATALAESCFAQLKDVLLKGSFSDKRYKSRVCPILKKKAPKKDQCGS
jgi:hypothetical protein